MTTRYRLTSRSIRGGMFYCVDKTTGKRTSLQTTNKDEAQQIIEAKNQAVRQPVLIADKREGIGFIQRPARGDDFPAGLLEQIMMRAGRVLEGSRRK